MWAAVLTGGTEARGRGTIGDDGNKACVCTSLPPA